MIQNRNREREDGNDARPTGARKAVLQYILPAVLTFLVGFLLWQIQRERVKLEYEVVESESFPREGGKGKYFLARLINSGSRPIENIEVAIGFPAGLIESISVSDDSLITITRRGKSDLAGSIPLLNPGEALGVTITTLGNPNLSSPRITARAVGVTALLKKADRISDYATFAAIIGLVVSVGVLWWVSFGLGSVKRLSEQYQGRWQDQLREVEATLKKHREEHETERREYGEGKPDREQFIFAALNKAGLGHLVPELVNGGEMPAYWSTGLFLLHWFLIDQPNGEKYIKAMQMILDAPEVAPSSLGFNLYLLAKMEQFRGSAETAMKYLEQCRKRTPLMYEHLMAQDPAYDLQSLQRWLFKKVQGTRDLS